MILAGKTLPLNCLCGALLLMVALRSWRLSWTRRRGKMLAHFYVTDREGAKWHFRVIHDILPEDLYWVLFIGRFERVAGKRT